MATEVSFCIKILQFLAVVALTAYFAHHCVEIYQNKDRWASNFYSAYGAFDTWWNK